MNKYIVSKSVVYESFKDDLFTGYAPTVPKVPEVDPWLSYIGPKITFATWRELLAFFAWSYEKTKSEAQARFYFNKESRLWRAWAFPQEASTGMTTKEIEDKSGSESKKAGLGKGWIEGGTIHHHCGSSAFQSSTDRTNELDKNGIHITVGDLTKPRYSIHGRVSFRGMFYNVAWSQWFVMPPGLEGLPYEFEDKVMEHFLTEPAPEDYEFPDEWKENLIDKKYASVVVYSDHSNWHKDADGEWVHKDTSNQSALSKRERKRLKRLMRKANDWTDSQKADLSSIAVKVVQICSAHNIEAGELFRMSRRPVFFLDKDEVQAVQELEEAMDKTTALVEDVEDWVISCREALISEGA